MTTTQQCDTVTRELPGNLLDDLLILHHANPERYPHLLQSAAPDSSQATVNNRYDILFAFPQEELALHADGRLTGHSGENTRFLDALDAWQQSLAIAENPEHAALPFTGGWFVYLSYELAGEIEPSLKLVADPVLPTAFAVRCPAAIIRDRQTQQLWLIAETGFENLLDDMTRDVNAFAGVVLRQPTGAKKAVVLQNALHEDPEETYLASVARAREYILAGDVFQANLSRGWQGELAHGVNAAQIYQQLRQTNPAPFAGLATWQNKAIISSSPERLVSVRNNLAQTRPIAGTRPRLPGTDAAMLDELIGHPKERAEHVMLIDLERNDLGRVCQPGSIEVSELMVLESYAHVHHIVSNVRGQLRAGITPGQVIAAVFPGGTITGCPKVHCMELIAELETAPRGAYTGSMGYLNRDGSMDFNILIRTLVSDGQRLSLRAGAGIVADSIPENELQETRAKAHGMLLALT